MDSATCRVPRSTSVIALAQTTPYALSVAPAGVAATAARNLSWFPCQLSTCGWYTSSVALGAWNVRGHGSRLGAGGADGCEASGAAGCGGGSTAT